MRGGECEFDDAELVSFSGEAKVEVVGGGDDCDQAECVHAEGVEGDAQLGVLVRVVHVFLDVVFGVVAAESASESDVVAAGGEDVHGFSCSMSRRGWVRKVMAAAATIAVVVRVMRIFGAQWAVSFDVGAAMPVS